MSTVTFQGNPVHTVGVLPAVGAAAPAFTLTTGDLRDVGLEAFADKVRVLNIVPSLDTGVCALSAKRFNSEASKLEGVAVVNVSMDLPFAQGRFCSSEGLKNVSSLSGFRSQGFGRDYGVLMTDGPLAGLYARSVVVVDRNGHVAYTQLVPEITKEPDYAAALAAVKKLL
eukprot:m51a1_g2240 putative lipid hydroperoxide peroxidase (170) ;mRNA; r:280085-280594